MGIFRQFPYSNFHDMNMDEIIKIVKQLADEWATYQAQWSDLYTDTEQALVDFKAYVQNYFDTLDLSAETEEALNQMLITGVLDDIILNQLSPVVTAWLQENITIPEGIVIDTSLSIAGAVADAKVTGDNITALETEAIMAHNALKKASVTLNQPLIKGTIDNDTGEIVASTNNYCWAEPQPYSRPLLITLKTGYRYRYVLYDEDYNVLVHSNWVTSAEVYYDRSETSPYKYINIVLQTVPLASPDPLVLEPNYNVAELIDASYFTNRLELLPTGSDLDDVTGSVRLGANYTYLNAPAENISGILETYKTAGATYMIQKLTCYQGSISVYIRFKSGAPATWKQWNDMSANNRIFEYTQDVFTGSTQNKGATLKIMSYNVANYNNDTAVYISNEKRANIKKLLSEADADLIGVQEDNYIDGVNKSPKDYIFAPVYPVMYGDGACTIHSKINAANNLGVMAYSNGRWLRAAVYAINNKNVLFISTHPVGNYNSTGDSSAESISARYIEYQELFKWVHGEITLDQIGTGTAITCPTWDYCIITGDMNTITSADRDNLKNEASARNFTLANGGWLGWLESARLPSQSEVRSLSNIICSSNIIIDQITSFNSWYPYLYSDHVPLLAKVTLLI